MRPCDSAPSCGSDMEEFDSEDFSTSEEDEDYVPSGGEYSEDDVSELVKEDEVDGDEQTQKTKGKKERLRAFRPGRENKVASHLKKRKRKMPTRNLEEVAVRRKIQLQSRKKALGQRMQGKRRRMSCGLVSSTM